MTEIPAKTPNPMGNTEIDFPGTEIALLGEFVACAAMAETDDVLLSAAAVPDAVTVGLNEAAATVVSPLTMTPGPAVLVVVADEVVVETEGEAAGVLVVLADVDAGTVVKPLTDIAPFPATVVEEVAVVEDNVVVVELDEVVDDEVLEDSLDEEVPLPAELLVVSTVSLQRRTSSTAGWPLLSVIGVNVITHVSVMGPTGVMVLCTVVTVVESDARTRIGAAYTKVKKQERSKSRAMVVGRIIVSISTMKAAK